ncbi:hypothetical protein PSQ53_03380 [Limosilactobacillus reuteri]|uniref:Uncharacterized protein n=1 Tax=Limosilactobacillus reuteri TaxID=1598 RepID=A0AAW6JED6_LIMRT|nr:hypothetical protein [Limosilactobacillus reuteri]MDD1382005.1 hypothetical protein [Limosilactobacillus reuteri]
MKINITNLYGMAIPVTAQAAQNVTTQLAKAQGLMTGYLPLQTLPS